MKLICKHPSTLTMVLLLFVASVATAQAPTGAGGYSPDGSTSYPMKFLPFHGPDEFHQDFQLFSPAELGEFGLPAPLKTGYFATYDRIYINVSRPENGPFVFPNDPAASESGPGISLGPWEGDFTWGNRFEIGYMMPDNHGWMLSVLHIDGPNASRGTGGFANGDNVVRIPQIDFDPDDSEHDPDDDDYDPNFDYNVLPVSINSGDYSSVELNKIFRLEQFFKGGVLEPYIGLRYSKLNDFMHTGHVDKVLPAMPTEADPNRELVNRLSSHVQNNMFGGHLGGRWYRQRERWRLSADLKIFAMQNWQSAQANYSNEFINYGTGTDEELPRLVSTLEFAEDGSEFVFGTDLRVEAAYVVTRDITVRIGVNFTEFVQGIGRGPTLSNPLLNSLPTPLQNQSQSFQNNSSQDMQMVGVTMGLEYNH